LKEGLRVCEEVVRFILEDRGLTEKLKRARHGVETALSLLSSKRSLLSARDSVRDTGRRLTTRQELSRSGVGDIFFANAQRVKESLRVLEEFSKLQSPAASGAFKELRYRMYEIEKAAVKLLGPNR
jgi:thiamine-phosphate pyrophosphorylase